MVLGNVQRPQYTGYGIWGNDINQKTLNLYLQYKFMSSMIFRLPRFKSEIQKVLNEAMSACIWGKLFSLNQEVEFPCFRQSGDSLADVSLHAMPGSNVGTITNNKDNSNTKLGTQSSVIRDCSKTPPSSLAFSTGVSVDLSSTGHGPYRV